MGDLEATVETGFSGVVRVDRGSNDIQLAKTYGMADRAHGIPNEVDTRFATASGSPHGALTASA